jgi:hypothetical protein
MDKIFFLTHRTTLAFDKSEEFLSNRSLFGSLRSDSNLTQEGNIVLGEGGDNSDEENVVFENEPPSSEKESNHDKESVDKDTPPQQSQVMPYNSIMSFGHQVIWHWNKRKQRIKHKYAIAGWALCIMEDVQKDVQERLTGMHHDAIEQVVSQLHVLPCLNTNLSVSSMSLSKIIDTFWNEFKAFQNCTHPYHEPSCWASYDVTQGISYLWHEKYSIPYMLVLGLVACCVTSKLCGIGPSKRSWGRVKQIKDGKRSHLSGYLTEKRTILFVSSKISQAKILCDCMEKLHAMGHSEMFGDDDINFDLKHESFCDDKGALKEPAIKHVFWAWVEDWEEEAQKKNDCVFILALSL